MGRGTTQTVLTQESPFHNGLSCVTTLASTSFVHVGEMCTIEIVSNDNFEGLPLEPETARPLEGEHPDPFSEWPKQHDESQEGSARPIKVWYVRERGSLWAENESLKKVSKGLRAYNVSAKDEERQTWFTDVPRGELVYEIEHAYGRNAKSSNFPELVIVESSPHGVDYACTERSQIGAAYLQHDLLPLDEITAAVERFHNRFLRGKYADSFSYGELLDPIENDDILARLDEEVFSATYNETYRKKRVLTREMLIDCGFGRFYLDEDGDIEPTLQSLWAYINDHDDAHLRRLLTEERLRAAFEMASTFDVDTADQDYYAMKSINPEAFKEFADWGEYKKYQRSIAATAKKLKFEEVKKEMEERYFELLKEGIERIEGPILRDHDRIHREQRLIRPVIVSLSSDPFFQRYAIEHGANMIPDALEEHDAEKIVLLAQKMRASEASTMRERTQRTKRLFYRTHEDDLSGRSELTADTEQELKMLGDIFEQIRAKEILDVGCGEGRIAGPLARQGYVVTGLEANEAFRERAGEKIGRENAVIAGDVIDYRNSVPAEKYDAVTYTWHTILEAYGTGNTMQTLVSAWRALKQGGVLVFDQPTRENSGMEDGWYGDKEGRHYLAYLMDEEELRFTLRMAGFETPEIHSWTTKPTELYSEGMKKWTVVAKKPDKKEVPS